MEIKRISFLSYEFVIGLLAIIVVSITLLELSNILSDELMFILFLVNLIILAIFMVDFVFRLKSADNKIGFFKDPYNILDFVAIIPFELLLFAPQLVALRGLRVARFMRLSRLFRAGVFVRKFYVNIKDFMLTNGFYKFMILTIGIILIGAIGIHFIEYQHFSGKTFEDALWWSIVTAFTVGYGDISPENTMGRAIAVILMLFGIGFIGMVTGTLATYFLEKLNKKPGKKTFNDQQLEFIKDNLDNLEDMDIKDLNVLIDVIKTLWKEKRGQK
ncbi:MAG: ion transporter [Methanobacteriaceae archaeon]|nr:ion transporter [Methanobacteriaceae archaeon]